METANADERFIKFCNDLFGLLNNSKSSLYRNASKLRALSNRAKRMNLKITSEDGLNLPLDKITK